MLIILRSRNSKTEEKFECRWSAWEIGCCFSNSSMLCYFSASDGEVPDLRDQR